MEKKNINIIIIEDNVIYAAALQQFIETNLESHAGYNFYIHYFQTGESCLDSLNNNPKLIPDIIILDYFLNSKFSEAMNGLDVLFHLKVYKPDVEVLMLSGQGQKEVTAQSFREGAFDYIPKNNFAFPNVIYVIKACLHRMESKDKIRKENNANKLISVSL